MTTVHDILGNLKGVKSAGPDQWTARCPAHDDEHNSLSVGIGAGGRVLQKCHAGCSYEAVLAAEGLGAANGGRRRIVATYDYLDERARLLYQSVRYDPKGFVQRKLDGSGGWEYKLNGARRVLYRLPELLAADPAQFVFVVEGEKDADRLADLGLVATTNAGGAGKWRDEYSEYLRGRHVVIIPDNDAAGRAHAEKVARSVQGVAASVRILELPNLPKKGDVSDWLDAGGVVDELLVHAEESPPVEREQHGDGAEESEHMTDLGNARRMVKQHGHDLRYCHPWAKFLAWDGRRFQADDTGEAERRAKATVRAIYAEAAQADDDDLRKRLAEHGKRSESNMRIKAMLSLAQSEPGVPVRPDELDSDPCLLNVGNGTLDLRSGELRAHSRRDLITKLAPADYDHAATCPAWDDFLDTIMGGKKGLIDFLRRAVGYSLTGDTSERALFILYGHGANGKSTTLETIRALLGGYAARTPAETLLAKKENAIPNDVAKLKGARFVSASETEEGKRLAESQVKDMTGGDTISARFMRGEWFDFKPECKLWLSTNHKPVVRGTDKAIWDRLKLIPFEVRITEDKQDRKLLSKLKAELPGILAWAVRGCLEWQQNGLGVPDEVRDATGAYQSEMDVLAAFMADVCVIEPNAQASATGLYQAYKRWCDDNGERWKSQRVFGTSLAERGFEKRRSSASGAYVWYGIGKVEGGSY